MASRIYVGNLPTNMSERDLEDEFIRFGTLRSVWVARKPPGFAFVEFDDIRDAEDAVRRLDGFKGWRVEFSRNRGPRWNDSGRGPPARRKQKRLRSPPPYRRRSPSPDRYRRRSPSYERPRRRSPSYEPPPRRRSPSYEPRVRSRSPVRGRSLSRSPVE